MPSTLELQLYGHHTSYEDDLQEDAEEVVVGALNVLAEPVSRFVTSDTERRANSSNSNNSASRSSKRSSASSFEASREERALLLALRSTFVSHALEHLRHLDLQGAHGLRELARDLNMPNKFQMFARPKINIQYSTLALAASRCDSVCIFVGLPMCTL